MVISRELSKRKPLFLVVLEVVNVDSKVLLYNGVKALGLAVGLSIVRGRKLYLDF